MTKFEFLRRQRGKKGLLGTSRQGLLKTRGVRGWARDVEEQQGDVTHYHGVTSPRALFIIFLNLN